MARKTFYLGFLLLIGTWTVPADLSAQDHAEEPRTLPGATEIGDYESLIQRLRTLEERTEELESVAGGSTEQTGYSEEGSTGGSLIDRVSNLEQSWINYSTTQSSSSSGKPTLKINGRIHLDSWTFPNSSDGINFFENPISGVDPQDRLFFRRVRLKFEGDVNDNMFYRMQFDVHSPGEGEMKDIYIGFKNLPFLNTVKIGNQKRPLGMDHLNSSRFNIFIERPLVVEAFNEDARRIGFASYSSSEDEVYHLAYGLFGLKNTVGEGAIIGDSRQMSFNARLHSSPWYDETSGGRGYFHWAVSGMIARPDGDVSPLDGNLNQARFRTRAELRSDLRWINTGRIAGAERYDIVGLESALNIGPFHVVGEYQFNWTKRDNTTAGTGDDLYFHGAYIQAAYMLTGEHMPYKRSAGTVDRVKPFENFFLVNCCDGEKNGGWGAWQVAARYSYLDLSDEDILGGVENNTTLALVWYMNPNASLQFNAVYGEIRDHSPTGGFSGGHFTALGTRLRLNF